MSEIGILIKLMEKEFSIIQMEISMKDNGLMIKPMDKALILTQMEQSM